MIELYQSKIQQRIIDEQYKGSLLPFSIRENKILTIIKGRLGKKMSRVETQLKK